jgi:hypothetical protein
MRQITVSSQGFELNYNVPADVEEYNKLAPKRENAVLEDAVMNVLYRNVLNKFRDKLVAKLEEVTGVARINSGTEDDPVWESEGKYMKRIVIEVAKQRGLDPAAKATRETLLAEWTPIAQSIISGIAFDPSEREATGGTPSLAKAYLNWAAQAVAGDGGSKLATLLGKVLGTTITLTGDKDADIKVLAQAISTNEKRKRDAANAGGYDPTA